MPFFHGSKVEFPVGFRLTGPATRGDSGCWAIDPEVVAEGKRSGKYDDTLVYVIEGNGNPLDLLDGYMFTTRDRFLHEVEPEGELFPDAMGTIWKSVACNTAIVKTCLYRPAPEGAGR